MKYVSGHTRQTMQKTLLELVEHTDPHATADVYGNGEHAQRFEEQVCDLLAKEAAVFMPSGTMAQQIALRMHTDRCGLANVAMHPTCHLYIHENEGYRYLHQLNAVLVGDVRRVLQVQDLEQAEHPFAAIVIELPQRHNGGSLPSWTELQDLVGWCRERQIKLHLDGARLWETTSYYKRPLSEIAALFDTVYVSFYKGIGAMNGAMLLGPADFIATSKVWLRRHGGNLYTQFPYSLSAELGLQTRLGRMPAYYARTLAIAKMFANLPGVSVTPEVPHVNMFHLHFDAGDDKVLAAAKQVQQEHNILVINKLWKREFANHSVSEIYIGDEALALSDSELQPALTRFATLTQN